MDIIDFVSQEGNVKEEKKQEKTILVLTPNQEKSVLEYWNAQKTPPSLKDILYHLYPGKTDTRSSEGWAIKRFLATRHLIWKKAEDAAKEQKVVIELNSQQQEYIINNCNKLKTVEMAREIFNDSNILVNSKECDVIRAFLKHLSGTVKNANEEDSLLPEQVNNFSITTYDDNEKGERYVPPKNIHAALKKVNRHTNLGINPDKLTAQQKKELISLINYLHSPRFINQMCDYLNDSDRELFESTFIRCCYDKDDLSSEEIDQYLMYSTDVVLGRGILADIQDFQDRLNRNLENDEKISVALVEAIKVLRDDHDKCVKRQNDVLKRLTGTRNERKANHIKENQSLVQLVEAMKNEESRKRWAKHAQLRKTALKAEINRIENLDTLIAECFGVDVTELLNS